MSIHGAGDVNKDGYDDVIIGANTPDSTPAGMGRSYVFLGSANGLQVQPAWTVDGGQEGERFGVSVMGAGDINKDGYDDVVAGAYLYDGKYVDEGRVWGYRGTAGGLRSLPFWSVGPSGGERL